MSPNFSTENISFVYTFRSENQQKLYICGCWADDRDIGNSGHFPGTSAIKVDAKSSIELGTSSVSFRSALSGSSHLCHSGGSTKPHSSRMAVDSTRRGGSSSQQSFNTQDTSRLCCAS